jgi:hypothetical protein
MIPRKLFFSDTELGSIERTTRPIPDLLEGGYTPRADTDLSGYGDGDSYRSGVPTIQDTGGVTKRIGIDLSEFPLLETNERITIANEQTYLDWWNRMNAQNETGGGETGSGGGAVGGGTGIGDTPTDSEDGDAADYDGPLGEGEYGGYSGSGGFPTDSGYGGGGGGVVGGGVTTDGGTETEIGTGATSQTKDKIMDFISTPTGIAVVAGGAVLLYLLLKPNKS